MLKFWWRESFEDVSEEINSKEFHIALLYMDTDCLDTRKFFSRFNQYRYPCSFRHNLPSVYGQYSNSLFVHKLVCSIPVGSQKSECEIESRISRISHAPDGNGKVSTR